MRFTPKDPGEWLRSLAKEAGSWPLRRVSENEWITLCPECLSKIHFEVGADYKETNQPGAPTFEPMVTCQNPECGWGLLIVRGEVYHKKFLKDTTRTHPKPIEPVPEDPKEVLLRKLGVVGRR